MIALVGVLIEVIVLLCGAVWAVGKIRTTTETLTGSLSVLSSSIEKLEGLISKLDDRSDDHAGRLIRLEERTKSSITRKE